jgi:hypothetical protein
MNGNQSFRSIGSLLFAVGGMSVLLVQPAHAEWATGIGTGLARLSVDGKQGFNTQLLGDVVFDVDLDPDDISDLMESAFGFGGYATNGKLMIQYSLSNLQLEGNTSRTVGSSTISGRIGFEITGGEVTVGYPITQGDSANISVLGGVRYLKHDLSADLVAGAAAASRGFDHAWTDVVVGLDGSVPFGEKWSWNFRVDASGGDSEGTTLLRTSVAARFFPRYTIDFSLQNQNVEVKNGVAGTSGFYVYDADETTFGISFVHHFVGAGR